jgi:LysM repeat protein
LYHTVQPGQNLFRIGLIYGVSWTYLASLNGIWNPNAIYAGQTLCVSQ